MKPLLSVIICFFICCNAQAKIKDSEYNRYMKEMPIYPKAKAYDLKDFVKIKIKFYMTEDSFEDVTGFYIKQMEKKGWKIEFPNPLELKIWYEALNKDRTKTPNIMLGLINPKSKVNCNITIGVVKDARYPKDMTIITIYLTDTMLR
ncbi:MAG: hypothetical protein H7263_13470 [Candidatus Sericytochromatia bacterium]|nr:hypothetical protein [Candidatus Sericytochromatia bacterium]